MIRALFALITALHGLIHLIGFTQAWGLSRLAAFSGKTLIPLPAGMVRPTGLLWLLVGLGFGVSALAYLQKREDWWLIALPTVLFSQILLILYWPDAKAGTLVNGLLLVAALLALFMARFERAARADAHRLLNQKATASYPPVTTDRLKPLPPVVRTWLDRANVVGKPVIRTVRLKQKGSMRTAPEGNWMATEAEQYFTVDQPGFVWKAHVHLAPLVELTGRDKYENGHGNMTIKLLSVFPVVNAAGPEVDQGTLLRYLSEMMWFPTAALSPYIRWEAVGERAARATMTYGGVSASGTFFFTASGDVTGFETRRYMEKNGRFSLETWTTRGDTYKTLGNGIRIPTEGAATWKLKTGDFTWYKLSITELDYNKPVLY